MNLTGAGMEENQQTDLGMIIISLAFNLSSISLEIAFVHTFNLLYF